MDPLQAVQTVPHAPRGLRGRIRVPPSKSITQRALLAAAMAGGGSRVIGGSTAEDVTLLLAALRAVGFALEGDDGSVVANGRADVSHAGLFMGNNGTGARFLLAQLAALPGEWRLDGVPRLRERPLAPLVDALRRLGAAIRGDGARLPLDVDGRSLIGGEVFLDARESSQFASALLLLGARLPHGVAVRLATPPPSRPYLGLTADVLGRFGVVVVEEQGGTRLSVAPGLRPAALEIEGDWSAAAFPMAAVAVAGGTVDIAGVAPGSRQGDAVVAELLAGAGCDVTALPDGVRVAGRARRALTADLRDAPDLFPALAVVVAVAGGRLSGLEALRVKESDRLSVMASRLRALGFAVEADGRSFASPGGTARLQPTGAPLPPAGDHRIAMALAVAGSLVPGVTVGDPGCVSKSWPAFWQAWSELER